MLSREMMDAKLDEHFAFEARDDVEGVLSTLTDDVEHDIVGWPTGPSYGREAARGFYEALFADLADGEVRTVRRLYGDNFLVDESVWHGTAVGRPFGLEGRGRPLEFRLLHVLEFTPQGQIARENVWIDSAAIQARSRPERMRNAQRARTRQAIVRAAARLLEQGERPSLEQVADAAQVSRATAYRYFPGLDGLLSEAAVEAMLPEPEAMFGQDAPADPLARLEAVDAAFDRACREREVPLRLMLAHTLERSVQPDREEALLRQNRRVPAIEQALAGVGIDADHRARLVQALAMIIGTEGMIALTDVVGLDEAEARATRRWAISALLDKALAGGPT